MFGTNQEVATTIQFCSKIPGAKQRSVSPGTSGTSRSYSSSYRLLSYPSPNSSVLIELQTRRTRCLMVFNKGGVSQFFLTGTRVATTIYVTKFDQILVWSPFFSSHESHPAILFHFSFDQMHFPPPFIKYNKNIRIL